MKSGFFVLTAVAIVSLSGCKKQGDESVPAEATTTSTVDPATPAETVAPATADAPPAEATAQDRERAEQQAKLDYATMEDGYINDAKGHWATSAKASSANDESHLPDAAPDAYGSPAFASGAADNKSWILEQSRPGFDWLELAYDTPVTAATEVRIAFANGDGAQAISKIELIDQQGKAHAVWSGLSDATDDERGDRTWFVRKFEATPYAVKAVKLTIANNVESGYKHVDAVQLIGN